MISRVTYLRTSFDANTFSFKYDYILKVSTYEPFQFGFQLVKTTFYNQSQGSPYRKWKTWKDEPNSFPSVFNTLTLYVL